MSHPILLPRFLKHALLFGLLLAIVAVAGSARTESEQASDQNTRYLPIVMRNYDPIFTGSPFGVQMYFGTDTKSRYHQYLIDSKASWLRVFIWWNAIEPNNVDPSNFDWSFSDAALAAAREDSGGLRIIAEIRENPAWAATHRWGPINQGNLDDFAEFVEALVERYDGDGFNDAPGSPVVEFWEFYNEPDAGERGSRTSWGNHGAEYAQMLGIAREALKSANPHALVVFGGIAFDWFEDQGGPFVRSFLDDVLSAGGGEYFDIMNYHVYPAALFNWGSQGPGLIEKTQVIKNKLGQYGHADKPLIVSEAGWYRNSGTSDPGSPEIQARYVVQLYTQTMAANVKVMIWWMLYDPGNGRLDYGLVTNGEPVVEMPSFSAYKTIVDELGTASFVRRLSSAETGASQMEAYEFNDPEKGRKTYVAWLDPVDTTSVKNLYLPTSWATVRDIYGASQIVSDGDDGNVDGRVRVQVGGQPKYIEIAY